MASLVIAAHGHLAEGLVASSAMIVGPSDDVVAVTFEPSEGPDDLLAKYAAAVEASSSQEYLILVDLFGGSPYNAGHRGPVPSPCRRRARRARRGRPDVRHRRRQGPLRSLHPCPHHHFRR